MNILLLLGLVADTFLITSVNGKSVKENIKNYLGIETLYSIIGVVLGGLLLTFCQESIIKTIGGCLIISLQILQLLGFEYPEKVNSYLLGSDSLIIFSTLTWTYVPVMFVFELCAILLGTLVGNKLVEKLPYKEYYSNICLILVGISMIL